MTWRGRRHVVAFGAALLVLVLSIVWLARGTKTGDDGRGANRGAPTSTARPGSSAAPATTAGPAVTTSPSPTVFAVGTRLDTFVDTTRVTSPNGSFPGAPTRTLPTEFWYPASGGGPDAVPDRSRAPYPLIVFSHGYDVTPSFYSALLSRWAAAGYVVAAPTYPILSGNDGGASHVDYTETFADTSFVISRVLSLAAPDPIAGLVDARRIATAGHSDGEVIAYGLGRLECCRDARVRAVVAMAGDLENANNPAAPDATTPILHVMETRDEFDPYPDSIAWDRANLLPPRWLLTVQSSHVPPYTEPGVPAFELVATATLDFLAGILGDAPARLDAMAASVAAQPGLASLER